MRFIGLVVLTLALNACNEGSITERKVKCESPYFSGAVSEVYFNSSGTTIYPKDDQFHTRIEYSPTIKCEYTRQSIKRK